MQVNKQKIQIDLLDQCMCCKQATLGCDVTKFIAAHTGLEIIIKQCPYIKKEPK